jgi:hypothetical protein
LKKLKTFQETMKSLSNIFLFCTVFWGFTIIFAFPQPKNGQPKKPWLNLIPPVQRDVECPQVDYFNQTTGKIQTPDFPAKYANNADCSYIITVPLGKRVSIIFDIFETEDCCDYINIYEGPTREIFIAKVAGSNHSSGFIYTTKSQNIMEIQFISDANKNYQGFHAVFDAIDATDGGFTENQCSSNFTELSGVITNPNFPFNYPPNADCTYLIGNGNPNTYVLLTIEKFNTEACCDHLTIYNGMNNSAEMIMDLPSMSGLQVPQTTYQTTASSYMFVEFISDANEQYDGYSIKYEIIDSTHNSVSSRPDYINV